MAQTIQHEAQAPVKADFSIKPEILKEVGDAVMSGYQAFRFLAETFGAVNATDLDLTLSSDAAAGLAHMCEKVSEELINAYGIMPPLGAHHEN